MMNSLRNLDAFGSPVGLNFQGNDTIKSLPGAFLTIITYTLTLYVTLRSATDMINIEDPAIQNYVLTSNAEKMLETTINMPEWHTDIALGFANVNEGTNVKSLPENIGSVKIRIVSMEGYNIDTIRYDYLRLERCENNSFSDN